jgi:hypothetical protein
MTDYKTQEDKLLDLLINNGNKGVNSYYATFTMRIKQAPARIKGLKKRGMLIVSRNKADRSVDWILISIPTRLQKQDQPTFEPKGIWDFSSGNAVWKSQEELKPRQEALI